MKVQNNSIYMGDDIRSARHGENGKTNNIQRKSIDGTALQAKFDPIAAKREEAKKKAMKIVGDAFANELKIDDDLNSRRERIKTLQRDMGDANRSIKELEDVRSAEVRISSFRANLVLEPRHIIEWLHVILVMQKLGL